MVKGGFSIKINLLERRLYVYQGEALYGSYRVAIGKPSTPSPIGKWRIVNKSILAGGTVFGTRWMGLSINTYGIHGNNNPKVIGSAVSLGCIRMYNHDVETLYPLLPLGTEVEILPGAYGSGYPLPPYTPITPPASQPTLTPGGTFYVIKKGDTFWSIAQRYKISLGELKQLNPTVNPELIYPGDVIRVKR